MGDSAAPQKDLTVTGPLARTVTNEDRLGIDTLVDAAADAWGKSDMQALSALYDLPIYVGTDNSVGTYRGSEWDAEELRAVLTAVMRAYPKDVSRTDRRTPYVLSDSMAMVLVHTSVSQGGQALGSYMSAILVIKHGGRWWFKSGLEAGHGI